ncbi:MAG: amidohydrolase [Burkholderiales bacterium]|nr:amidohydrolase [Burkholderiales bacterium]
MQAIDIHNHVLPNEVIEAIVQAPEKFGTEILGTGASRQMRRGGFAWPLEAEFYDADAKVEVMARKRIDVSVLSITPQAFFYWLEPAAGAQAARLANDGIANMVAKRPDRLRGLMTLPMQDPDAAVAEMERAVKFGFKGIELGTTVEHMQLAEGRFRPVLRRAQELKLFVFAHPYWIDHKGSLDQYYLNNLIGNPLMTAVMVGHLMFGGVFDELPELKWVLAHGGGHLPYQLGRFVHGYQVRDEPKSQGARRPDNYLRQIYFDALIHNPKALRFLVDLVGAEHIMLGTDSPFDMGDFNPVDKVEAVTGFTTAERDQICTRTALALLRE